MAKKRGRPTKRVPRTLDRLEEALSRGLPRWAACAYAKISRQAFSEWLHDPAFEEKVLQWEAASMATLIKGVMKEPRGKQFLLARRFRADYGDKVELEQSGSIEVRFVDDWRSPSETAPAPQWSDPSSTAGPTAQHPSGGSEMAKDNAGDLDSDPGGPAGEDDPVGSASF